MSVAGTAQALNKLGDTRKPEVDAGRPTQYETEDHMQINQERIEKAIIEEAVNNILHEDKFAEMISNAVNTKINALFKDRADAQIGAAINDAIRSGFDREYCRVTSWGEKEGAPTTIRKELDKLIGDYWNARVDKNGKAVTSYGESITRAEWVMSKIVADDFNSQMKQHVVNVAGGLKDSLRRSLHETVNGLLSEVFKVNSQDDATLKRTGDACVQPKAK